MWSPGAFSTSTVPTAGNVLMFTLFARQSERLARGVAFIGQVPGIGVTLWSNTRNIRFVPNDRLSKRKRRKLGRMDPVNRSTRAFIGDRRCGDT
jgi:hypothetical protein